MSDAASTPAAQRRFCWSCFGFALVPLGLCAAVVWAAAGAIETERSGGAQTLAALQEQVDDLQAANAQLSGGLRSSEAALSAARAAALAAEPGAVGRDDLEARLRALPARERAALFTALGVRPGAQTLVQTVSRATPELQARFFAAAPDTPAFAAWFSELSADDRREWLSRLPDAPGRSFDYGADPASRYEAMRTERDLAVAERDAALQERRALDAALADARAEADALGAERAAWTDEQARLNQTMARLLSERTAAEAELERVRGAVPGRSFDYGADPATRYEELRTERDIAQAERDAVRAERAELETQLAGLVAERDRLRAEQGDWLRERDELIEMLARSAAPAAAAPPRPRAEEAPAFGGPVAVAPPSDGGAAPAFTPDVSTPNFGAPPRLESPGLGTPVLGD